MEPVVCPPSSTHHVQTTKIVIWVLQTFPALLCAEQWVSIPFKVVFEFLHKYINISNVTRYSINPKILKEFFYMISLYLQRFKCAIVKYFIPFRVLTLACTGKERHDRFMVSWNTKKSLNSINDNTFLRHSLLPYTFHTYLMQEFQIIARNGFYSCAPAR